MYVEMVTYTLAFFFYLRLQPIPLYHSSLPFRQDPSVSSPTVQTDRYLRSRISCLIIFHSQSPTTAAPLTPISNDTHKALPTVHHDEDYTFCIHAFITGLEASAYACGCCLRKSQVPHPSALHPCYIRSFAILTPFFPPHLTPCQSSRPILPRHHVLSTRSLSRLPELIEPSIPGAAALPILGGLDDDEPVQEHFHVILDSLMLNVHNLSAYTPKLCMHEPHSSFFIALEIMIEVLT